MTRPGDLFADQCQRLAAVLGQAHGVAGLGELLLQQRTDVGIVVDDEHGLVARLMRGNALAQLPDERFDVDGAPLGQQFELRGALYDGQREGEGAAVARLALDPDAAAVVFHDLLADGQAEAGAFGLVGERVAYLLEFLEDLGLIGGGDADAGVLDADDQFRRPC